MGFELYFKHEKTCESIEFILSKISESGPLVGLKLGKKNEIFDSWTIIDAKEVTAGNFKANIR